MEVIRLEQGWQMRMFDCGEAQGWEELKSAFVPSLENVQRVYEVKHFPAQVHDVLLACGIIKNPNIRGRNQDLWIDGQDWAYCCSFSAKAGECTRLRLEGVDTFADVWLNGYQIGSCANAFLEYEFDVTGQIRTENTLIIYFHSAKRMVEKIRLPKKYEGKVPAISVARIFRSGFHEYCGPVPSLIRCGLYGDVWCRQSEEALITDVSVDVRLTEDLRRGTVEIQAAFAGNLAGAKWQAILSGPDHREVYRQEMAVQESANGMRFVVEEPVLWWPWTHGEASVYTVELTCSGSEEKIKKQIGFRRIEQRGELDFWINGRPIKLWGVNLAHPDTLTNCYDEERMGRLLDLARLANCNTLRIWGESEKYPEAFYEECDRRGILLWQDFYLCCSMYLEEPEFLEACGQEARQMVRRLKAHPSILLWCGGNELFLARDYGHPGEYCFGEKCVREVFPAVCEEEDPERYYHVSSPCGGGWANDPSAGDTHGYTHLWFVPGRKFPVFLSENCRVSTPPLITMERMMEPEELWPENSRVGVTRRNRLEWPESWNAHTTNECWRKLGPVEHYPEAQNVEELIYRIGAAHAEYIHEQVCRFRRGYSGESTEGVRKTRGHLLWKFNNNSNIISYGVVDYFLEPGYAFYELKRCYAPFLVSCELGDRGYVWITNDTAQYVEGRLEVTLFHLQQNRVTDRFCRKFAVQPDASCPVCSLDPFGQFRKENIVCVKAYDEEDRMIGMCLESCEIERRMEYPSDTGIAIIQEGQEIVVTSRAYARCVMLTGEDEGDRFGWIFEDNYFDLLPGHEKRVRVDGKHQKGTVFARAYYDDREVSCQFVRS